MSSPKSDSRTQVVECRRRREHRQRPPEWATTPTQRRRLLAILQRRQANDADTQARRILEALRGGPCTTYELRDLLDVLQVGARIHSLRKSGHAIERESVEQAGTLGRLHRIACYTLICEAHDER
jgi:hypothetical protein